METAMDPALDPDSEGQATLPDWPAEGRDRGALEQELTTFEAQSGGDLNQRNLFEEGPHLSSSPALPWGDEVRASALAAYARFMPLENWTTGQGGREMERQISRMMGSLLHGERAVSVVSSGGTESNLVGMAAAKAVRFLREYPDATAAFSGRKIDYRHVQDALAEFNERTWSVLLPVHAHYSFSKGCALLGLRPLIVPAPPGRPGQLALTAARAPLRELTLLIVATAGSWPFGTLDQVAELGTLAGEHDIPIHIDACVGGFLIPFLELDGYYPEPLTAWDFRVPAVQTISADAHKNGMAPKPASTITFRDPDVLSATRLFLPPDGLLSGTRTMAPVAATWFTMQRLGLEGYVRTSRHSMALRDELMAGITEIEGLEIVPGSVTNFFSVRSENYDLRRVAAALEENGWRLAVSAGLDPLTMVLCTMPKNDGMIRPFLEDLRAAVEREAAPLGGYVDEGRGGVYGLMMPEDH
jgi:glutamate/tyrosine decarboxylase-like PLP-dependent enzyme